MKEKHIYLGVGMPGVGKSTYFSNLGLEDATILSSDAYIEEYAQKEGKTYDQVFREAIGDATARFNAEFERCLRDGVTPLIIDRTNLTVKSRIRYIQNARRFGYRIHAIDMNSIVFEDPGEWLRRLAGRIGKKIPGYILENMKKTYEAPALGEGFDTVIERSTL